MPRGWRILRGMLGTRMWEVRVLEGPRCTGDNPVVCGFSLGRCSIHWPFRCHCSVQANRGGRGRSGLGLRQARQTPGRPQSRTHSYEQTPTAPPCPDSLLPSEIPLSVGCKGRARGKTEPARLRRHSARTQPQRGGTLNPLPGVARPCTP